MLISNIPRENKMLDSYCCRGHFVIKLAQIKSIAYQPPALIFDIARQNKKLDSCFCRGHFVVKLAEIKSITY